MNIEAKIYIGISESFILSEMVCSFSNTASCRAYKSITINQQVSFYAYWAHTPESLALCLPLGPKKKFKRFGIESLACMHTCVCVWVSVYGVYLEHVLVECVIRVGDTVDCSHYYFKSVLNNVFALNWRRFDFLFGYSSYNSFCCCWSFIDEKMKEIYRIEEIDKGALIHTLAHR